MKNNPKKKTCVPTQTKRNIEGHNEFYDIINFSSTRNAVSRPSKRTIFDHLHIFTSSTAQSCPSTTLTQSKQIFLKKLYRANDYHDSCNGILIDIAHKLLMAHFRQHITVTAGNPRMENLIYKMISYHFMRMGLCQILLTIEELCCTLVLLTRMFLF